MTALSFSKETRLDDPAYPRLKEYLLRFTGLAYYGDRDAELARLIGRRLIETDLPDCGAYLDRLEDTLRGPSELDALIAEVAIGETYFFRHQEHFEALRDKVLPELIDRNQSTGGLRIWCAGCSDGSEPYSVSILLQREFADRLTGWDVEILATDISRRSLARARAGQFPIWALRATPELLKQECFTQQGTVWNLNAKYKKNVTFRYHNLVGDMYPSASAGTTGAPAAFDLIICRNVMIYFSPERMQGTLQQFHQRLVPGGWLLVGPAEPNMTFFRCFHAVQLPGLTLYQKADGHVSSVLSTAYPKIEFPSPARLPAFPLQQTVASTPEILTPELATVDPPAGASVGNSNLGSIPVSDASPLDTALDQARAFADAGQWELAASHSEGLLESHALNPRVHLIRGLVLDQMGQRDAAEQCLRRAIYLDRQSVLAHYYLGLVLQALGRIEQASRSLQNALGLLDPLPGDYAFQDGDGISASELKQSAALHLEILREQLSNAGMGRRAPE